MPFSRHVCFSLFVLFIAALNGQSGPRSWRDHLGISSSNSVTRLNRMVYASYKNGLIRFDEQKKEIETLNKTNGLNDVGVRLLRVNPNNKKLLIVYNNCNIDVIDATGAITNYPYFKNKTITGRKYVNEVTFYKNLAYLACGFGIVVFDMDKLEIRDTYYIGKQGADLEVYQIALNDSVICAATATGLYSANYKRSLLNNFQSWQHPSELPIGPYCGVIYSSNKFVSVYSLYSTDRSKEGKDTFYVNNGNKWKLFTELSGGHSVIKLGTFMDTLFHVYDKFGVAIRKSKDAGLVRVLYSLNEEKTPLSVQDVYYGKDYSQNISYWVADELYGLFQSYYSYLPSERIKVNGTRKSYVSTIDVYNGTVAIAPSYPEPSGATIYLREGLNVRKNGDWSYLPATDSAGNDVLDFTSVLLDRKDRTVMWAASWYNGLFKYENGVLVKSYTVKNSGLADLFNGMTHCISLTSDADGNVWFAQSDSKDLIGVIKRDGSMIKYRFESGRFTRKIFIDKNKQLWALHEAGGGITVYKFNNFNIASTRTISADAGAGNLGSNAVYSIAEDQDGRIWVGTEAGIRVFYSPANITTVSNYDAQPIKIVQDGNVELLLEKETVTSIVVDGANNKWVGTRSGGVYCFSPDGITQLYHFTAANSPLYSNNIIDLNYDATTGDVYIGTEVGLQSFRSTILNGSDNFGSIMAFPNPVRPDYTGTVLIRGLINNSIVKVADPSGNVVWETKAEGGQVEWPLTAFSGTKVAPGVYLVYASSEDAEAKVVSKILIMR
jgi:sugar lactone lactonase YvrE